MSINWVGKATGDYIKLSSPKKDICNETSSSCQHKLLLFWVSVIWLMCPFQSFLLHLGGISSGDYVKLFSPK